MPNIKSNFKIIIVVQALLILFSTASLADEMLYESGQNQYITITKKERVKEGQFAVNEHPITFSQDRINYALSMLEIWDKNYFKSDDVERVFTVTQARTLAKYLSEGLAKVTPEQDILFGLVGMRKGGLGTTEITYTAGRVFFAKGKLNIIIGDYNRPKDKGLENYMGSSGTGKIKYFLAHGMRKKAFAHGGHDLDEIIIMTDGVQNYVAKGKKRKDWLVLDVGILAQAYETKLTKRNRKKKSKEAVTNEQLVREQARLAKERREMRIEMARMRKEMKELSGEGENTSSSQSIEARISTLDSLLEKKLISEDEYNIKRKEILEDI